MFSSIYDMLDLVVTFVLAKVTKAVPHSQIASQNRKSSFLALTANSSPSAPQTVLSQADDFLIG